jgi:lipopolysaccharide/colanic/teichoic acid biosynthesis glycosyltransferase
VEAGIDLAGAITGLVLLFPLFLLVGLAICLLSAGPPLFRQKRVGYQGTSFTLWKFRTLKVCASCQDHQRYMEELARTDGVLRKPPVTRQLIPFGGVLRALAIDELPQLINVVRGEMSLVGPRPDVIPYENYLPRDRRRFDVLPGMTGLWQVSGKNGTTFAEMMQLDVRYAVERSLWLDAKILLTTVPAILGDLVKRRSQ